MISTIDVQSVDHALPYQWLCIDIETGHGRPEDCERLMRLTWAPDKRWKDDTIGKRYKEALQKKIEKRALIDESPIKVVSLRSDSELRCLHWIEPHEAKQISGGLVEGFATQREMLIALRALLDARVIGDTPIVGHNIIGFDLPRLRWAYIKERLRLPDALHAFEQATYDVMREFCRRYTVNKDIMISFDEVLEQFGLPSHKGIVSGPDIPDLIEQGETDLVVQYALLDVVAESDLFLRMTGGLEDDHANEDQQQQQPQAGHEPANKELPQQDAGVGF
jgi:hypothetical protein